MANSNGWGDGASNNSIGWGQGANNNIGWGDSHAKSWAGATDIVGITTDADAQAFITAAAITDPTQQTAINNLVLGMKADGIWTKMKAVYPFVGGTATTHKWNLKDPRDLDAAFRLVFNGGWTHSSNGAQANGTNGYADTYSTPNLMTQNSISYSIYIRNNVDTNGWDFGCDSSNYSVILTSLNGNTLYSVLNNSGLPNTPNTDSRGYYISSRTASNVTKTFRNNSVMITDSSVSSSPISTNIVLNARNSNGSISSYATKEFAFATIGDGLTDTEAANLYTRVQAFQTQLFRAV